MKYRNKYMAMKNKVFLKGVVLMNLWIDLINLNIFN